MLERLQGRDEACYLVGELSEQIILDQADVQAKLRYILRTIAHAKERLAVEDLEQIRQWLTDPQMSQYFEGSTLLENHDAVQVFSATNTGRQILGVTSYVAASGLVFAHSFFEYILDRVGSADSSLVRRPALDRADQLTENTNFCLSRFWGRSCY